MALEAVVIIMAKQPQVGRSKTRLCPPLTMEEAALFAEALLRDTVALVAATPEVNLAVAITPAAAHSYFEQVTPPGALLLPVEGQDIGQCIARVLAELLALGYRKVLALNADSPSLPQDYLCQAVNLLEDHDLVLGPSRDGGYYLIGMKALYPSVFEQIHWSTPVVLSQTLERAQAAGLRAALTSEWYDIDTASDLVRLALELEQLPADRLVFMRQFLTTFDWKGRIHDK
jgi:uncharacterized protein